MRWLLFPEARLGSHARLICPPIVVRSCSVSRNRVKHVQTPQPVFRFTVPCALDGSTAAAQVEAVKLKITSKRVLPWFNPLIFRCFQSIPWERPELGQFPILSSRVAVLKYTRKTFVRLLKLELMRQCGQRHGEARRVWPQWCGVSVAEDTCRGPAEKLPRWAAAFLLGGAVGVMFGWGGTERPLRLPVVKPLAGHQSRRRKCP
ncbi:hypothetical protein E2C01_044520 [Portunus trituberculatus]|uniref:Uncharacterized protein n=1 Tax=Portunus trituberculatus TaxID=210409 RepID=A0A5B7FTC6_PORTR|nr:hypothetical protein [Portunus trituberculatus]